MPTIDRDQLNRTERPNFGPRNASHSHPSPSGRIHMIAEHIHNLPLIFPSKVAGVLGDGLAAPVTLTAAGVAYTLGALVEIIPANTLDEDYDIHFVNIEDSNTNGTYIIEFYYGADDVVCGRIKFTRTDKKETADGRFTISTLIPKNSRLRAAAAHSAGAATIDISVEVHEY